MKDRLIEPIKDRVFRHAEQMLGVGMLVLIVLGCIVVLRPFFSVILWSAILCYATWPACEWLVRHLNGRRGAAALAMTLLLVLLVALPVALVGYSLAGGVEHLLAVVRRINIEGIPTPPEWLISLPWVGERIESHWDELSLNAERTTELLRLALLHSRGWLLRNSLQVGQGILQVCLSVVVAFFFYRDGHQVARRVTEASNRIVGEYTPHLITLTGRTVRGVVYGLLGTALGQGIMAAIGFSITGVPAPFFWALVVALLSFLPFGPPIIWIGASCWLLVQGAIGPAVFMAVWGLIGISGIDNVLRPILISRNAKLSFLPVMLGVLGGLMAFGLIGVFLGPTLLAVGMNLAKEFGNGRRGPTTEDAAISAVAPDDATPDGAAVEDAVAP
jgi:predicted PurR-regulated permease PerM